MRDGGEGAEEEERGGKHETEGGKLEGRGRWRRLKVRNGLQRGTLPLRRVKILLNVRINGTNILNLGI